MHENAKKLKQAVIGSHTDYILQQLTHMFQPAVTVVLNSSILNTHGS